MIQVLMSLAPMWETQIKSWFLLWPILLLYFYQSLNQQRPQTVCVYVCVLQAPGFLLIQHQKLQLLRK